MLISEIWSISAERIEAFFLAQTDLREIGKGRYARGLCELRVTPLPERPLGRFFFPQTRVEFEGPEEEASALHRRFVLQFLSAGG